MKPVQLLISILILAYATITLKSQTTNDTLRITYKGKGVTVRPQGNESKTTIRFKDTLTKKNIVVKVSVKDIDGNDDKDIDDIFDDSDTSFKKTFKALTDKMGKKEKRNFIENSFLPNFDLGFVTTINDNDNAYAIDPLLNKSANINWGIFKQDMNLYKGRVLFSYGFNLNTYYLKYSNKQNVQYINNQGHLGTYRDTINNFDKNRLDVHYYTIPVLLEYHGKDDNFKIAAGVECSFGGRTKVVTKGDNESLEFKRKEENNVKIDPTQLNAVLRVGYKHLALYARYSITDMYRGSAYADKTNPNQHLFSVGLCLFGI